MCQTSWLNDTKKSDRLEAAIPSLSPATLKFFRLVKYPTERLPRRPSWRDCAYECVITSYFSNKSVPGEKQTKYRLIQSWIHKPKTRLMC